MGDVDLKIFTGTWRLISIVVVQILRRKRGEIEAQEGVISRRATGLTRYGIDIGLRGRLTTRLYRIPRKDDRETHVLVIMLQSGQPWLLYGIKYMTVFPWSWHS